MNRSTGECFLLGHDLAIGTTAAIICTRFSQSASVIKEGGTHESPYLPDFLKPVRCRPRGGLKRIHPSLRFYRELTVTREKVFMSPILPVFWGEVS